MTFDTLHRRKGYQEWNLMRGQFEDLYQPLRRNQTEPREPQPIGTPQVAPSPMCRTPALCQTPK